jgi:hypothetical protein
LGLQRGISIFRKSNREYHASGGDLHRSVELLEKNRSEATMDGTALQEIEPKLRAVIGYRHLRELREAMKDLNFKENIIKVAREALFNFN